MYGIIKDGVMYDIDDIEFEKDFVCNEDTPYYGQVFRLCIFIRKGKVVFNHLIHKRYLKEMVKDKGYINLDEHDAIWG